MPADSSRRLTQQIRALARQVGAKRIPLGRALAIVDAATLGAMGGAP